MVRKNRIFTDMITGATDEREGLQRLLTRAEKDDVIICTKMDRLRRNTADTIRVVGEHEKPRGSSYAAIADNVPLL
ncbi:recombinase family protein [Escherichia coli]|uniref:recombinase family protein n=1 Tax=Escherichia coli TaxID=562 RepID=UPI00210F1403|nr:recombinase family protein [Escherichia coli]